MFEKLQIMEQKFEEISQRLSDPAVTTDIAVYTQLMKEYKNLEPIVQKYRAYKRSAQSMQEARELLDAGSDTAADLDGDGRVTLQDVVLILAEVG